MVYFLGARSYDFEDDKGKAVSGVTVWFCDDEQNNSHGFIPFKASMSVDNFKNVFGGYQEAADMAFQPVKATFNRYGKPTYVEVIPEQ